jgi:hypothetical protein
VSHVFKRDKTAVTLPAWSRYRTHLSAVTTLAIILRRTKVILRRMTTVLSSVLGCGFILLGGACHGGKHGHASLRLPGDGSGSFHGHRNGPCDAPTIGAVKSLLSTLPTAAPNGWHSVLASRGGTAREHVLRGCESSLVRVHRTAWKTASRRTFPGAVSFAGACVLQATAESPLWAYHTHAGWPLYSRGESGDHGNPLFLIGSGLRNIHPWGRFRLLTGGKRCVHSLGV